MPRFFIDYEDGTQSLKDDEGEEYPSLEAARDAAIAALPDIGREAPPRSGKRTFAAYVRDEDGTQLCTVTLNLDAACYPERMKHRG
ncbi:hypothetical protein VQ02_18085 [Methylobacterium variabile]|jgi:hypothetical protein|uniref:DUF6894 domain-containing protein n=1 Tax=Methylobacterium variabile TaxID=298794 RepID=A0A0J6SIH9_9HYPH|nr:MULTISPECIES: hypothetical protein [Methylobacterium]KMO35030.1 hypothetical protein VQ02_18085 [Methylobacterium variabile]UHC20240.1 hypothetical protein LRS73_34795 [Methylobacterium currus]